MVVGEAGTASDRQQGNERRVRKLLRAATEKGLGDPSVTNCNSIKSLLLPKCRTCFAVWAICKKASPLDSARNGIVRTHGRLCASTAELPTQLSDVLTHAYTFGRSLIQKLRSVVL